MSADPTVLYICPNCFLADVSPGACPECGHTRVECDLGDSDNPPQASDGCARAIAVARAAVVADAFSAVSARSRPSNEDALTG